MATCDEASLADTAEGVISPTRRSIRSTGSGCSDGWAYAFVTIGPADGSQADGYTMTMIFQAEGQFWCPRTPWMSAATLYRVQPAGGTR
jgi:hypothetical protein